MPERARASGSDVHSARIAAVLALLLLLVAGCAAAVYAVSRAWDAPLAGSNAVRQLEVATPQLQSAPQQDRAAYFAQKDARLNGYGWVDRERGVAHIPIDAAMRLLTSRPATVERPDGGAKP